MAKENPNTELNKHRESRVSGSALLKALLMEWKPASFRKLSVPVQIGGRANNISNFGNLAPVKETGASADHSTIFKYRSFSLICQGKILGV